MTLYLIFTDVEDSEVFMKNRTSHHVRLGFVVDYDWLMEHAWAYRVPEEEIEDLTVSNVLNKESLLC